MVQALCIVGAVILAALFAGALVAWLVGRARQEIDSWKIDAERL